MGVTGLITSNFDLKWFQIAVEHERAALGARARAVAAADGSTEMGEAFDEETKAAMVAVGAAAFSIDALYVRIDDSLDPALRVRGRDRVGNIVESFKVALDIGSRTQVWQQRIPALFALRDRAVHFRGTPNETQPHPTGKSNVSLENVVYSAEAATNAVDLALEVLTVAYRSPRPKHSRLVAWSHQAGHVPDWLETLRNSTGAQAPGSELSFTMREVFPADDPVARFVMACSIALGDLRVAADYAVRPEQPDHERIYFVRLLISHMRETVKLVVFEHRDRAEVQRFVARLPPEAREAVQRMSAEADPEEGDSLFADLKRIRDDTFHYAREGEDDGRLEETLHRVAGYQGVYRLTGDRLRAEYADLVVANAMHPHGSDEKETHKLAEDMQQRMVDLLDPVSTFLQEVEIAWLKDHPAVSQQA